MAPASLVEALTLEKGTASIRGFVRQTSYKSGWFVLNLERRFAMSTSYDQILYRGLPYAQTHPDRLATLACLFGMKPAPVESCRVLEIGCGDGWNLIPAAFSLPGSSFTGFDLAETPIEMGRTAAAELGLTNLKLEAADIMEAGSSLGEFDYIIAHGIYSWVPEPVRNSLLAIARDHLAPKESPTSVTTRYPAATCARCCGT